MESEVVKIIAQLGFPIASTLFFFGWFFGRYLPAQNETTERRFQEIKQLHEQSIAAHFQESEHQRSLFEASLNRIMEAFARLELAVQGLQQRIETAERHRRKSKKASSTPA